MRSSHLIPQIKNPPRQSLCQAGLCDSHDRPLGMGGGLLSGRSARIIFQQLSLPLFCLSEFQCRAFNPHAIHRETAFQDRRHTWCITIKKADAFTSALLGIRPLVPCLTTPCPTWPYPAFPRSKPSYNGDKDFEQYKEDPFSCQCFRADDLGVGSPAYSAINLTSSPPKTPPSQSRTRGRQSFLGLPA